MTWTQGAIDDIQLNPLSFYKDERGWLAECFRVDELAKTQRPMMGYVSMTRAGVVRGPHEHRYQSDLFVFFDGTFAVYLWDNREASATYGHTQTLQAGTENPVSLIIPPGVVHGYKNIGPADALIINCPNKLYAGWDRAEEVDEIRHEDQDDSPFTID